MSMSLPTYVLMDQAGSDDSRFVKCALWFVKNKLTRMIYDLQFIREARV